MNISISYEERISLEENGILDTHVFVLVRFYLDNFCPKIAKNFHEILTVLNNEVLSDMFIIQGSRSWNRFLC